jgi:broad specificity phosphatase PhoE
VKIYFVRHGQSEANVAGIVAGDEDPKLTEAGINQARKTGQELVGKGISQIFCSPLTRAQQTAETIALEIGLGAESIQTLDGLTERGLGEKEGKPKDQDSEWFFVTDTDFGLEPRQHVFERMQQVLTLGLEQKKPTGNILFVGHSISGFYLCQVIKGKQRLEDFEDFHQLGNADFTELNWGEL